MLLLNSSKSNIIPFLIQLIYAFEAWTLYANCVTNKKYYYDKSR